MAVQQEIKSQLAKLLATEDLVVEHKQVSSAQFNVHTRVLTLPLWDKASNTVYDLLVGHEVGHALYTPDEDPPKDIPFQFVNVVEDARIEKLMKRKYRGLAKTFYNGYNELYNEDFFEIDGEDINSFNLADRANLFFKIGNFLSLVFSSDEKPIIEMIERCETFDDVKKAALVLYEYCKEEKKEEPIQQDLKVDGKNSGVDGSGLDTDSTDSDFVDGDTGELEDYNTTDNRVSSDSSPIEPEVQTAESLDSKLQELVNSGGVENEYIEVQKVNLDTIIISNQDIHLNIGHSWHDQGQIKSKLDPVNKKIIYTISDDMVRVDNQFYKFKKDAQKEVSYLVKEFECRKSASAYIRSTTNRTGVLDTKKLQTYKFNEDLFKKVTIVPDGKNHGLVFILDWSGSMQYVLQDTIKQLYNLLWFCRKVQIPFEVYAFTSEWSRPNRYHLKHHYERKEGVFHIEDEFNLMNLFTSKVNGKTLEDQMINIWRIVTSFKEVTGYLYPDRLILSGTPLNEALVALHQILPKFQKENKLEKVQCIVLTDGEANPLPYHKTVQRHWESEPYLGCRNIKPHCTFLRDRKVGKTYKIGYRYHDFTDVLLNNLKDRFPSTNFIGIRVLSPRDANSFMRLYKEDHSLMWKKNKSFVIKNSGYDAYFVMSSNILAQDTEFEVEEDATKSQIKRAFVKSLKTKKLNKKVLGEFISLVA
jgi:hypothetical protein